MTSPFEQIAPQYAALWSDTAHGRAQREQVWREVDALFQPGDRVLDLGCGTGDDAAHLMSRGVAVIGIDSASGMVEIARNRGVESKLLAIEDLGLLEDKFDGAISNFGAVNCIADLSQLGAALARLVRPQGKLALCVMSRYYLGDWRHLISRWRGHAVWRGMNVYYRSTRSMAGSFTPHFEFERRVSIGRGDHQLLLFARRPQC